MIDFIKKSCIQSNRLNANSLFNLIIQKKNQQKLAEGTLNWLSFSKTKNRIALNAVQIFQKFKKDIVLGVLGSIKNFFTKS